MYGIDFIALFSAKQKLTKKFLFSSYYVFID